MCVGMCGWKKGDLKGVRESTEWCILEEAGKYAEAMHKRNNSGCEARARVEAGEIILTRNQAGASFFLSSECGGVATTTFRTAFR